VSEFEWVWLRERVGNDLMCVYCIGYESRKKKKQ